ncbi:hypothetical protein BDW42DRAFT_112597 [Aspergillus taichungensis]|uniref:Uncharacterized protein n=1 Tax=Aspergillus taichungensis TaxID=482145 RepID=A0A2J5HT42_9EURO|nr:hypothetical protein BDW42DRAFT_112597 [Aspergillus taichungensis]
MFKRGQALVRCELGLIFTAVACQVLALVGMMTGLDKEVGHKPQLNFPDIRIRSIIQPCIQGDGSEKEAPNNRIIRQQEQKSRGTAVEQKQTGSRQVEFRPGANRSRGICKSRDIYRSIQSVAIRKDERRTTEGEVDHRYKRKGWKGWMNQKEKD